MFPRNVFDDRWDLDFAFYCNWEAPCVELRFELLPIRSGFCNIQHEVSAFLGDSMN